MNFSAGISLVEIDERVNNFGGIGIFGNSFEYG